MAPSSTDVSRSFPDGRHSRILAEAVTVDLVLQSVVSVKGLDELVATGSREHWALDEEDLRLSTGRGA